MKTLMVLLFLLWPLSVFAVDYPDLDKYYPLAEGNKWVYAFQIGFTKEDIVERGVPENNFYIISSNGALGKFYYSVRKVGDRIVRVASQNVLTGEIQNDVNYKILVAPFKKGLKWFNSLEKGSSESYKFIGFVETSCKAGKFKDVAKFEYRIKSLKSKEMIEYQYFAPNVGLIKTEGKLPSKSIITIYELVDYKIKNGQVTKPKLDEKMQPTKDQTTEIDTTKVEQK